ncbi:hypothetical protein [Arthrobacter methylotrophus]|uniref:hypothetical protein n=1 Tax=Arthrobacter methylotrophus TaxID=121291 RepID=UPI0031F0E261
MAWINGSITAFVKPAFVKERVTRWILRSGESVSFRTQAVNMICPGITVTVSALWTNVIPVSTGREANSPGIFPFTRRGSLASRTTP